MKKYSSNLIFLFNSINIYYTLMLSNLIYFFIIYSTYALEINNRILDVQVFHIIILCTTVFRAEKHTHSISRI